MIPTYLLILKFTRLDIKTIFMATASTKNKFIAAYLQIVLILMILNLVNGCLTLHGEER